MSSPSGHKSYALHYKVGGKSRKLTIGNADKVTATRARELAQEALQAIKDGADPQSDKRRLESAQTVAQVFDAFMKQPKRDGAPRAAATIEDYHRNFERFIEPYIGSTLVSSVGQADCNRIIEAAREGDGQWSPRATARPRRSTPRTTQANRVRALLRAVLHFAHERELIDRVPRMDRAHAEIKRTPSATAAEVAELGEALRRYKADTAHRPWVVASIEMMIYSGARYGEILGLRWDNIDLEAGEITLTEFKGSTRADAAPKILVITPEFREILERAKGWSRRNNPFVFPNRTPTDDGKPGHYQSLRKDWDRFRKKYLGHELRLHDLRHIAASAALNEAGLSTEAVGKLLGHSRLATTQRYARVQTDAHHRAAHTASHTMADLLGNGAAHETDR